MEAFGELKTSLYLITKLQNLKAIHNVRPSTCKKQLLYLITKLQNLKAIHNDGKAVDTLEDVVSNYKITKSESYSQQVSDEKDTYLGCI